MLHCKQNAAICCWHSDSVKQFVVQLIFHVTPGMMGPSLDMYEYSSLFSHTKHPVAYYPMFLVLLAKHKKLEAVQFSVLWKGVEENGCSLFDLQPLKEKYLIGARSAILQTCTTRLLLLGQPTAECHASWVGAEWVNQRLVCILWRWIVQVWNAMS